jgi:transcriptional regulator with XRE-family HTH domain
MSLPFGLYIRELRSEKRLSVRKLAELVDISAMHISKLENEKSNASPELIAKLAIALEIDPDILLQKSNQVAPEIIEVINSQPETIPAFLRSAKGLSPEQWEEMNTLLKSFKK